MTKKSTNKQNNLKINKQKKNNNLIVNNLLCFQTDRENANLQYALDILRKREGKK
jgi:hypothetical protein